MKPSSMLHGFSPITHGFSAKESCASRTVRCVLCSCAPWDPRSFLLVHVFYCCCAWPSRVLLLHSQLRCLLSGTLQRNIALACVLRCRKHSSCPGGHGGWARMPQPSGTTCRLPALALGGQASALRRWAPKLVAWLAWRSQVFLVPLPDPRPKSEPTRSAISSQSCSCRGVVCQPLPLATTLCLRHPTVTMTLFTYARM